MKWTVYSAIALVICSMAGAQENKTVVRKHWFVSGQVQGVGFRAFTYEAARDLKLRGWVRNLTDHRVEIVAEGAPKQVEQLLEKVKKGPQFGRVDSVKEGKVDEKEKLAEEFEIRDSAAPPKE
jgi:acylphosphatase